MVCNPESLSCAIWQIKPSHPHFVPRGQEMDCLSLHIPGGSPGSESHLHGLCPHLSGPTGIWQQSKCFQKKTAFFPILIFFSIIAYKANPTLHDDLVFWHISLSGISHLCGVWGLVVVAVRWGSQAQWGRRQCPAGSSLSVEHLVDPDFWAHLVFRWAPEEWTYLGCLCCQAGHQETSGWGYLLL